MKFVHYILVNAVSRLSMDKNADTYAFATHCFFIMIQTKMRMPMVCNLASFVNLERNIHSFHWHVQNSTISCPSHELLPFLSVMYFSCHPSPPTILPSSLTSSCHLFLGSPLNLVVPKFIYNTLLGILFSSILCTCPNQCNIFNLIVSTVVGFITPA